jgi:biotin carboxyl carrier protein
VAGATCHGIVESELLAEEAEERSNKTATLARSGTNGRIREQVTAVELDGRRFDVKLLVPEPPWVELAARRRDRAASRGHGGGRDAIVSPMQGTVLAVNVAEGDAVEAGGLICVVEAMKMENLLRAERDGRIGVIHAKPGDSLAVDQAILEFE